jgi:5'-deoxy-5'-methylthioadenosine phosphorylase
MSLLAIIGGTGLTSLDTVTIREQDSPKTLYGPTSAPLVRGTLAGKEIVFLARHGHPHAIPPHRVNYRANIRALKDCGVTRIIAINAVGGITGRMRPCVLALPDQIIDYTWSRDHTYFNGDPESVNHIDFTAPYTESLRKIIRTAARKINLDLIPQGTYGATQGPRLETAAEIRRMEGDGCDIVGMTGMPEAALARELEIDYASICLVVNWAAGKTDEEITMDIIRKNLEKGMEDIKKLLAEVVRVL